MMASSASSSEYNDAEDDLDLENIGENTLLNCHKHVAERYKDFPSQPRQTSQQQQQQRIIDNNSKSRNSRNNNEFDNDSNSSFSSIQDMFGDTTFMDAQINIANKYPSIANKLPHRASVHPSQAAQSSSLSASANKNKSKRRTSSSLTTKKTNNNTKSNNFNYDSSSDSSESDNLGISNIGDETMQQHLQYVGDKYQHLARKPHSRVPQKEVIEIDSSANSDDDDGSIYISHMDEDLDEESLLRHQQHIAEKYKHLNTKPHIRRTSNTVPATNVSMKQQQQPKDQDQRKVSRHEKENESLKHVSRSSKQDKSGEINNSSKNQLPTYSKRESIHAKPATNSEESTSSSTTNSNPNQPRTLSSRNIYISQQSTGSSSSGGLISTQQQPNENGLLNNTSEQSVLISTPKKKGISLNINESIGVTPILKDDVLVSKRKSMLITNDERKEKTNPPSPPAPLRTTKPNNTTCIWEESTKPSKNQVEVSINDDTTSIMEATAVSRNMIPETIQTEPPSSEDEQIEDNNNNNNDQRQYYYDGGRNQEQFQELINVDKSVVSNRNPSQSILSSSSFLRPNIPSSSSLLNNVDKMRISKTNITRNSAASSSTSSSIPKEHDKESITNEWVRLQAESIANKSKTIESHDNNHSIHTSIRLPSRNEKSKDSTELEVTIPKQTSAVKRQSMISSSPKVTSIQENRKDPITPSSLPSNSNLATKHDDRNIIHSTASLSPFSFSPPHVPNQPNPSIYVPQKRSIISSHSSSPSSLSQVMEKTSRNSSRNPNSVPTPPHPTVVSSFPTGNKRRTKVFQNLHDGDESGMETERCHGSDVDEEEINLRNKFPSMLSRTRPSTSTESSNTGNNNHSEGNTVVQGKNSSHNKSKQKTRVSNILQNINENQEQQEQQLEAEVVSMIDSTSATISINNKSKILEQQDIENKKMKENKQQLLSMHDSDSEEEQEQQPGEKDIELNGNESTGSNDTVFVSKKNMDRSSINKKTSFESSTTTSVPKSASVTIAKNMNNTTTNYNGKETPEQLLSLRDTTSLRKNKETSMLGTSVQSKGDRSINTTTTANDNNNIIEQFEPFTSNNDENKRTSVQKQVTNKSSFSRNETIIVNKNPHENISKSRNSQQMEVEETLLKRGLNRSSLHTYVESESDVDDDNYSENNIIIDNKEKSLESNSRIQEKKSFVSHRKETTATTEPSTSVSTERASSSTNKEQIMNSSAKAEETTAGVRDQTRYVSILDKDNIFSSSAAANVSELDTFIDSDLEENEKEESIRNRNEESTRNRNEESTRNRNEESIRNRNEESIRNRNEESDTITKILNFDEDAETSEINQTDQYLKSRIFGNHSKSSKNSSDLNILTASPSASTASVQSPYLHSKFQRNNDSDNNKNNTHRSEFVESVSETRNEIENELEEEDQDLSHYDTNDDEEFERSDIGTSHSRFPNSSTILKIERQSMGSSSKPSSIFASPGQRSALTRSISSTPIPNDSDLDLKAKFLDAAIARSKTTPSADLIQVQSDVLLNTNCNLPIKVRKLQSANIFPMVLLKRVEVPTTIPPSSQDSSSKPQNESQQLVESNYSIRKPSRSSNNSSSLYSKEWQKTFLRKKSNSENSKIIPSEIYGKIVSSHQSLTSLSSFGSQNSQLGSQNSQFGKLSQTSRISDPLISNSIPEVEQEYEEEEEEEEEVNQENIGGMNFDDDLHYFNPHVNSKPLHSSHNSRMSLSQCRKSSSVPSMMLKDSEVIVREDSLFNAASRPSAHMTLNSTIAQPIARSLQATGAYDFNTPEKHAQSHHSSNVPTVENMDQSQPPSIFQQNKSSSKIISTQNKTAGQSEFNVSKPCRSSEIQNKEVNVNDDDVQMDTGLQSPASDQSISFHLPHVVQNRKDDDDDENMDMDEENDNEEISQEQIENEYQSENGYESLQEPIDIFTSTAAVYPSLDKNQSVKSKRCEFNLDQDEEISKSNESQNQKSKLIDDEAQEHEQEEQNEIFESAHSPRINDPVSGDENEQEEEPLQQQNSSPKNISRRQSPGSIIIPKSPKNNNQSQHQSLTITTPRTSIPKRKYNRSNINMESVRESNQEDSESEHEQQQQIKSLPRKRARSRPRKTDEAGGSSVSVSKSKQTKKPSSSSTDTNTKKRQRKKQDPSTKYLNNDNMISKELLQHMLRVHNLKLIPSQFKSLLKSMNDEVEIMCDALMDQAGRPNGMFTFRQLESALKSKKLIDESLGKHSLLIELANLLPASTYKAAKGLLIPQRGCLDTTNF